MYRLQRRKSPLDYLLPFLILISVGIIIILGVQLAMNWGKQGKGDVHFFIAEGKAKVLPYSNTDWDNAFSGTKLLLGDSLKTSFGSKAVLQFFNGTIIRLAADTAVTLNDVTRAPDKETIVLNLDNGIVWINGQKSAGVRDAVYEIRTKNLKVSATGTVFEVESDDAQIVRVFDGDVQVDVLVDTDGKETVADTIPVGVGQQLYLDAAAVSAFGDNESPSVLTAIDDNFEDSTWYKWNTNEDSSPTDFSAGLKLEQTEDSLSTSENGEEAGEESDADNEEVDGAAETTDEDAADTEEDNEEEVDSQNNLVSTPEIIEPRNTKVASGKFAISGTVGSNATKVVVESEVGGKTDSYTLSQFKAGDSVWSYNVSESFGNVQAGSNIYKVYAYDAEGNKSNPATITITYGEGTESEEEDIELNADLSDPKVLSYNGGSSSVVTADTVKVAGSIEGASKVVVNGYTLSKFTAGATTWNYIASESLGNLKPGENSYEVYGIDPDGNKSKVVSFSITYNKAAGATETSEIVTPVESFTAPSTPTTTTTTTTQTSTTTTTTEPTAAPATATDPGPIYGF